MVRNRPRGDWIGREAIVGRVVDDAVNAHRVSLKDDRVRRTRESERAGVDEAQPADRLYERAVAVSDDHRSGSRREAFRPSGCDRGEPRPVGEHREHSMRSDRHICEGRHMCAFAHRAPFGKRRLAGRGEARLVLRRAGLGGGHRLGVRATHAGGVGRPRRDRRVECVAVRDVDRAVGKLQRAKIADERIVVAGDEVEPDAAREAEIAEELELHLGIALEARVMQFGGVAVDDHAVVVGDQRLKRASAARASGATKVEVAQDQRALER